MTTRKNNSKYCVMIKCIWKELGRWSMYPFRRQPVGWLLVVLAFATSERSTAQNLHLSQFFNAPLLTNAANAGFIPEADFRIGANYRSQWASLPVPFKTMGIWGDAQVFRDRFETGWIGVGGQILRDVAGSGNLSSTKVYGSAAYHQMLGATGLLSAGFSFGFINKRVDVANFTFDDQWNGKFFDYTIISGESFLNSSIAYTDIEAGLNYAWFPTDDIYLHGGLSVKQLNRPKETFFLQAPGYNRIMDRRYTVFLDAVMRLNDQWILSPGGYFSRQSKSQEIVAGLHANYNLSGTGGEHQLIGGAYYRHGDAVIPMVGYQWKNIRFMFSYDATTSPLGTYINMQGASEMSILHNGFYIQRTAQTRQSMCPKF